MTYNIACNTKQIQKGPPTAIPFSTRQKCERCYSHDLSNCYGFRCVIIHSRLRFIRFLSFGGQERRTASLPLLLKEKIHSILKAKSFCGILDNDERFSNAASFYIAIRRLSSEICCCGGCVFFFCFFFCWPLNKKGERPFLLRLVKMNSYFHRDRRLVIFHVVFPLRPAGIFSRRWIIVVRLGIDHLQLRQTLTVHFVTGRQSHFHSATIQSPGSNGRPMHQFSNAGAEQIHRVSMAVQR